MKNEMKSDFKFFNTEIFNNVKIKGLYEWNMKPLVLIVNVSFSIKPTEQTLEEIIENPSDFSKKIKKQLSPFSIDDNIRKLQSSSWKYDGSRWTFGHDVTQIKSGKSFSSLGIDLYFQQINKDEDIKEFFKSITPKVATCENFISSKDFVIRQNRKNVKNKH